jgi:hypothetical protein
MTHTHRNIPDTHILTALRAALLAGEAILEVYTMKDREITTKEDNSPLTLADRRADNIIKDHLETTGIPVFTEESSSTPYEIRKGWKEYWLVDPLDGTKEFIKKNDEFTVNIALIRENLPVFGVIYLPVFRQLYMAIEGRGSYRMDGIDHYLGDDPAYQNLSEPSPPYSSPAYFVAVKAGRVGTDRPPEGIIQSMADRVRFGYMQFNLGPGPGEGYSGHYSSWDIDGDGTGDIDWGFADGGRVRNYVGDTSTVVTPQGDTILQTVDNINKQMIKMWTPLEEVLNEAVRYFRQEPLLKDYRGTRLLKYMI